jgi:diguanylate cyclase (GGDEF)-like protein
MALQNPAPSPLRAARRSPTGAFAMTGETGVGAAKTVCLLGGDAEANQAVSNRLSHHGIPVRDFSRLDGLLSSKPPEGEIILVLDTGVLPPAGGVEGLLIRLEGWHGRRPDLVCIAHSRDLELRLQALRAGALAFRLAPVNADELAGWLTERSGVGPSEPYRVLVVDDEPVAATFASRVLEKAGIKTRSLVYPLLILDVMEQFRPDLVLMDMHMPEVTGVELTAIIREHEDFDRLPVVFLSRELQPDLQLDALRRGGDDFLTKPVDPHRLVGVVQRLIQVSRVRDGGQGRRPDLDPKSGLCNRQAFLRRVNRALPHEQARQPGSGVLFVSLDSPEAVVGRIGEGCIDTLIRRLGRRIGDHLAPSDTAGRVGDFSFGLLAMRSHRRELVALAEGLRESLAGQTEVGGRGSTTASIGIGLFGPRADDALTVLSRAQKACSEARAAGGNRVAVYSPTVGSAATADRGDGLAALLQASLRDGGLQLFFQPIVAMRRSPSHRYEASLRLRAPDGEYIPPFDFLPVAEERGLMRQIDRWVIERALDRLCEERPRKGQRLRFHVQQTIGSAVAPGWVSDLRDGISGRDLIKMRPVIQFRFPGLEGRLDAAAECFAELGRLGIGVCLTEFSGDPDGLHMVERMHVPLVKLSQDRVHGAGAGELPGLIAELHRRRIGVIAAGIDSSQGIARLWGCGVDYLQGDFLQLPAQELSFDFSETAVQ